MQELTPFIKHNRRLTYGIIQAVAQWHVHNIRRQAYNV